jgi:site-specific DNA-methyltransferase (adenine-specific)
MLHLLQGECLDAMKRIPDCSIDAIITDLPFNLTDCKWDQMPIDLTELWAQYNRIIKSPRSPVILFSAYPFTIPLNASNVENFRCEWIWLKNVAHALNAKYHPMKMTEYISVFARKAPAYHPPREPYENPVVEKRPIYTKSEMHGGGTHINKVATIVRTHKTPINVLYYPVVPASEQYMKTQKPLELMKFLVETYTSEGDVILDCTMGSGSTGAAALELKRHFIGIEKNPDHFAIAHARLNGLPIPRKPVTKPNSNLSVDPKLAEVVSTHYQALQQACNSLSLKEIHQKIRSLTGIDCNFTSFRDHFYSIARARGDHEKVVDAPV